ncbi:MAG: glycerophosphodiester phosphodiesterase family protein [Cytophagaceae bacterium]|nr:glycerophosphodiester phosphodiesterase family protein [Cytophagaceae bacterium]MBK9509624.1 glycerophosphodiester phosphodiesterase family protein [Cytophagaceae bacterium]MBK9936203.1 glycerophosphodiester phosphodiesterase family protein [Cytophagaceae bacterium]MBL0303906.1 glycerophosphodiester phosphodiesterase family protein [Cytophagaceae bacterium]MBL0326720.1 glycerophosphodiester phosphodiesterase family protein [Cytophagaceae bacterium]
MKKLFFAISVAFMFLACKSTKISSNYIKEPQSIFNYFEFKGEKKTQVSVHRGGGELAGYPENCLESFQYINSKMPCIIECDVEMTKDSVLVLMHDKSLDRTSTGTGLVVSHNFSEIQEYYLKDNFGNKTNYKIPTLDKTLDWGRNKVIFTLDVKKTTPYRKVIEMVEAKNAQNFSVIITYNANEALEVFKLNPNVLISVSLMQESDYQRLKDLGIPDKNMLAFIGTREPKAEFIDFLHKKGIKTILGVLGNLDKKAAATGDVLYDELIKKGVDIFATDRPEAVFSRINIIK